MKSEKEMARNTYIRLVLVSLLLLATYLLDTAPFFWWQGISPDFLLLFALGVSLFSSPLEGAVFSVIAGLLKDIPSTGIFGFNGAVYLVLSVLAFLTMFLFIRRHIVNALAVMSAGLIIGKGFYYFIFNVLFEKGGRIALFWNSVVPSILISILFIPLYFYIPRMIYRSFSKGGF